MHSGQAMNFRGVAIIGVSAAFSVLAAVMVALRFVVKRRLKAEPFLDDYLIIAALAVTIGVSINNIAGVIVAGIGLDEIYRTDASGNGFPFPEELLPQGKVMFALQILHTCAMPLIKASILAFYWRIFKHRDWFRVAVKVISIYITCWWISFIFATIFQCNPISDNWGTQLGEMNGCLPGITIMYKVAAFTNMLSDIAILSLPFPIVCKLQMLSKHKFAVLAVFMTGAIVVIAGIGRTVAYFSLKNSADYNFSADYYPLVIWTSLEPSLGIVGACLPTIRPLFHGFSPEIIINSIRSAFSLHSARSSLRSHPAVSPRPAGALGFYRTDDDVEAGRVRTSYPRATRGFGFGSGRMAGTANLTTIIELDEV